MSRTTRTVCDGCGKVLEEDPAPNKLAWVVFALHARDRAEKSLGTDLADLCPRCSPPLVHRIKAKQAMSLLLKRAEAEE
jgi:transcription initiation factor TFIIIB Brf1 subunit/transcription initiation factor TFIIB